MGAGWADLVALDAVHDGDVLPGAVVVEEGGVATVWGRDPPAVQLRAIRHAEIDIVAGEGGVVGAAGCVRCSTGGAACGSRYGGKWGGRGGDDDDDDNGDNIAECNRAQKTSSSLYQNRRLVRWGFMPVVGAGYLNSHICRLLRFHAGRVYMFS